MSAKRRHPAGAQPGDVVRNALLGILGVVLISDSLALIQRADASPRPVVAVGRVSAGSHQVRPSRPTAVVIPRILVNARLTSIHIGARGELQAPTDYFIPGWWSEGVMPGSVGPAIIVGHVDSLTRPAVFYRLRQLKVSDTILIPRKDGTTAVFAVDALREFTKDRFPTRLVYGHTKGATLRLITCGGRYDAKSGHYLDNIVVFAHLTKLQPKASHTAAKGTRAPAKPSPRHLRKTATGFRE